MNEGQIGGIKDLHKFGYYIDILKKKIDMIINNKLFRVKYIYIFFFCTSFIRFYKRATKTDERP